MYNNGLNRRLGLTVEELRVFLCQEYNTKSIQQIARDCKIDYTAVRNWFKKLNIPLKGRGKRISEGNSVHLSEYHLQILDGLMLGDGNLDSESSRSASYCHSSKYKETLCNIQKILPLEWYNLFRHKTTLANGKTYYGYKLQSCHYLDLKPIFDRWYSNSIKRVPQDIELTKLSLYHWYVGDGSLNEDGSIVFATHCFSNDCLKVLKDKLNEKGIVCSVCSSNVIRIPAYYTPRFFELIGPVSNLEYKYKWDVVRREKAEDSFVRNEALVLKNDLSTSPNLLHIPYTSVQDSKIIELTDEGKTAKEIADILNRSVNSINHRRHLLKHKTEAVAA